METDEMFEIEEPLELMPFQDKESQYWYVRYLSSTIRQYENKAEAYKSLIRAHTNDRAMTRKKLKEEEAKNAELHKKIEEL